MKKPKLEYAHQGVTAPRTPRRWVLVIVVAATVCVLAVGLLPSLNWTGSSPAYFDVKVMDSVSGVPIVGATVSLPGVPPIGEIGTTGQDGRTSLRGMFPASGWRSDLYDRTLLNTRGKVVHVDAKGYDSTSMALPSVRKYRVLFVRSGPVPLQVKLRRSASSKAG